MTHARRLLQLPPSVPADQQAELSLYLMEAIRARHLISSPDLKGKEKAAPRDLISALMEAVPQLEGEWDLDEVASVDSS